MKELTPLQKEQIQRKITSPFTEIIDDVPELVWGLEPCLALQIRPRRIPVSDKLEIEIRIREVKDGLKLAPRREVIRTGPFGLGSAYALPHFKVEWGFTPDNVAFWFEGTIEELFLRVFPEVRRFAEEYKLLAEIVQPKFTGYQFDEKWMCDWEGPCHCYLDRRNDVIFLKPERFLTDFEKFLIAHPETPIDLTYGYIIIKNPRSVIQYKRYWGEEIDEKTVVNETLSIIDEILRDKETLRTNVPRDEHEFWVHAYNPLAHLATT